MMRCRARRAFTLIEVLMVVAITGMLLALLLAALSRSREAARRVRCLSNLHQDGLAMLQEAMRRGRFPASGNFSAIGPEQYHSWVVTLLRDLDCNDLADGWDYNQPHDDTTYSSNGRLSRTAIAVLTCPSDPSVVPGQGNLSYAVNSGFGWTEPVDCPISPHWGGVPTFTKTPFDFDGDGRTCGQSSDPVIIAPDRMIYFQTGLFFVENWPYGTGGTSRHHSLTSVTDGSSNTLMLTENVRAGYDPFWQSNWSDPWPPRNSIFLSGYVCKDSTCRPGNVDYGKANDRAAPPQRFEAINAALDQAEGEAPWPSSAHGEGVNVVFVDGHARFLRQSVSGAVYAALLSPQGMRIGNPALQQVLSGGEDD